MLDRGRPVFLSCTLVYIAYNGIELISIVIPVCCGLPLAIDNFSLVTLPYSSSNVKLFYMWNINQTTNLWGESKF
jgi:hypothetical protein